MQYVKFIKKYSRIFYSESSDISMSILGFFLDIDVGICWPFFKDFITMNQEDTTANASFVIKQGNNIRIEDLYDDREIGDKPAFIISKDEYIQLLDMWIEAYKQQPDEILVTYENGKIDVKAINRG